MWRQGRLQNGDALVFGSIETLVSFSLVWYGCVVVGCKMTVWPRSCQVRCARRKSCKAMVEGFITDKISNVGFCFAKEKREVVELVYFGF